MVRGIVEAPGPINRMPRGCDMVAHGGAQPWIILDQQDTHAAALLIFRTGLAHEPEAKLKTNFALLQPPFRFQAHGAAIVIPM
jgi:hypothetical protein